MFSRPKYLEKYYFDWELFNVLLDGKSALDAKSFLMPMINKDQVINFLDAYGFDSNDLVLKAELFGNFQEALQFIKKYFLKEGNEEGLDLELPHKISMINDISDLFLMASGNFDGITFEECIWAGIVLRVIHTIIHVDKDIRSRYFNVIQQQVFDRFYKYVKREGDELYLESENEKIPLIEFETKARKKRDSTIIKLLHKVENVAEELFDRIGVRFICENKHDALRIVKFLHDNHIILAHNVKPSRSLNTLINTNKFRKEYRSIIKKSIRNNLSEEEFFEHVDQACIGDSMDMKNINNGTNEHTNKNYKSIQFTCRQLIKYKDPFISEFLKLRNFAKETDDKTDFMNKVLSMDISSIGRDIRFFYPFEVQIVDKEGHENNTQGLASHAKYKKSQIRSAMIRVFSSLIEYKNIKV